MHRRLLHTCLALALLSLAGCAALRPDRALRTATGTVAHDLCSQTFVSGLDPDQTFAESIAPRPGLRWIAWGLGYHVDRPQQQVTAAFAGGWTSRAVHRGRWGCVLVHGDEPVEQPQGPVAPPAPALLADIAGPQPVATADPQLQAALDAAFVEPPGQRRQTQAVVVVHDGRIIAERYAPGYGTDTPLLGFSMTKSVVNALVGVLVQHGRLAVDQPAPVPAWQGDARAAITVEHLMRMNSGLELDETGSGFDPSNHMFYLAPDMAAYAQAADARARPGARWAYSSASTHLLARMVRDAAGGTADAVQRFAAAELFGPLGMRHVTLEMDATGTPVGGHYMLATPRDWARFGLLFLNDGVVGGRRLLPPGWAAFSATPTPGTNYGAGWWAPCTPRSGSVCVDTGVPPGAYLALGNLGQRLAVIPSHRLVVLRMGRAHGRGFDVDGYRALVDAAIAAVGRSAPAPVPAQ